MIHLTLKNRLEIDPHICDCISGLTIKIICPTLSICRNVVLVSGIKLEGKPFHYQSIYFSPPFLCVSCASSTDSVCVSSKWWIHGCTLLIGIILIILTLVYQVTILMIIHCNFGLVFLHLFSLPLDTLWQQQISMVENSLFKIKSFYLFRMLQQKQNPKQ